MALIKEYPTPFGVTANYHKIVKIELLSNRAVMNIMLAIYATEEAKNAGGAPLWNEYVEIPFSAFKSDPRQAFYPLLETYIDSYLIGAQPSYTGELDVTNALVLKPFDPTGPIPTDVLEPPPPSFPLI